MSVALIKSKHRLPDMSIKMRKRRLFEFIGGAWDGMNLDSGSQDAAERDLALLTYVRTHSATIGKSVVMPSDYAAHKGDALSYSYVVAHCAEVGEEALVRMECCRDEPSESGVCMAKHIVVEFHGGYLHGWA